MVTGPEQQRIFRIQVSKYEFCVGKSEKELDNYVIYVYTPAMIAIEKLRAICQQMPEYSKRRSNTPRARDFYDIHAIVTQAAVDLASEENLALIHSVFAAKSVALHLLGRISEFQDFHRQDWPAVRDTTAERLQPFDFYFEFVLAQVRRLEAVWVE